MNLIEIGSEKQNYNKIFSYKKNLYYTSNLHLTNKKIIENWANLNKEKISFTTLKALYDDISEYGKIDVSKNDSLKIKSLRHSDSLSNYNNIGESVVKGDAELVVPNYKINGKLGIERIKQDFLVDSPMLRKTSALLNIHSFYRKEMMHDNYKNLNIGFRNYNCINFYKTSTLEIPVEELKLSIENGEDLDGSLQAKLDAINSFSSTQRLLDHNNFVMYPNPSIDNQNIYPFNLNDGCISLYLNANKVQENDIFINPKCIVNLKDKLSLYYVRNTDGDNTGFRILLVLDNYTNESLNVIMSSLDLDNPSSQTNSDNKIFLSSDNFILYNYWTFIAVNFYDDYIVIHNNENSEKFQKPNIQQISGDSFITLGNRLVGDTAEIYSNMFTESLSSVGDISGPYVVNSIGSSNIDISKTLPVNSLAYKYINNFLVEKTNFVTYENMSESFIGEIHDIKMFSESLSEDSINELKTSSKVNSDSIMFYVPVYFVPLGVKKRVPLNYTNSYVNTSGENLDIAYSSVINSYLHDFTGEIDLSVENFLVEINKKLTPLVCFGGDQTTSRTINKVYEKLSLNDLDSYFKQGISIDRNILKIILEKDLLDSENWIDITSHFEKNNLIIPCDNGIQDQDFSILEGITESDDFCHVQDDGGYDSSCVNLRNIHYYDRSNLHSDIKNMSISSRIMNDIYYVSNNNYHIQDRLDSNSLYRVFSYYTEARNIIGYRQIFGGRNNCCLRMLKSNVCRRKNSKILDFKKVSTGNIVYRDINRTYSEINSTTLSPTLNIFFMSKQMYDISLKPEECMLLDRNKSNSGGQVNITLKDTEGLLYRADCLSPHCTWNYVGNVIYNEGLFFVNHPALHDFGQNDFEVRYTSKSKLYVKEVNVDLERGSFDKTFNKTYIEDLKIDDSSFNADENFVYITDIDLHDKYLNTVAKAKLATPFPKKSTDSVRFRLKLDF
jgi:hypothetical protein